MREPTRSGHTEGPHDVPTPPLAVDAMPRRGRMRRRGPAGLLALGLVLGLGGTGCQAAGDRSVEAGHRTESAAPAPRPPDPVLRAGGGAGPASWDAALTLRLQDGVLARLQVLDPDGAEVAGSLVDATTWRSAASSLLPAATYLASGEARDLAGGEHRVQLTVHTTPAARILHARLSPGDGDVVGIGQPVVVTLNHPVSSPADRALVVERLSVVSAPAVLGAWRWMAGDELHYRGPTYWSAGTRIRVSSNLRRLHLSDGTWGSGLRTTGYRVGAAVISTVDVSAHVMTVRRDGEVVRVAKVSTGRDKYPTKGGVHLVLEKTLLKIMDSETVGIPRKSPDGYYEKVPFSVRISYGGAFVHSADWSLRDQGVRNVSHGCVNMSPADAKWFYGLAKRGDIVDVVHATAPPVLYDPGTSDWNIPFDSWGN